MVLHRSCVRVEEESRLALQPSAHTPTQRPARPALSSTPSPLLGGLWVVSRRMSARILPACRCPCGTLPLRTWGLCTAALV